MTAKNECTGMEIGNVTYEKMVAEILKMIDLSSYDQEDMVMVLFNPLPYTVNGVVKTCICTPASKNIWDFIAVDSSGHPLRIQDVSRDEKSFPVHDLEARPWPYLADRHVCYLETGDVPACGYKTIGLEAAGGVKGECKRSGETVIRKITSRVTLNKGTRRVDIKTTVHNNAKNHRLRVALPTGIKASNACASGHFTVDQRPVKPVKDKDGKYWPEMQTLPMQHFVDVSDGQKGIALLNNCLTEYEVRDDENATAYLTLFRSMGNMIVTWWEAVGVFPKQNGSQLQRTMEFEYSIYPHDGTWDKGLVYREAEQLNAPVTTYQVTPHSSGTLPQEHSFLTVEPENLMMSAFKTGTAQLSDPIIRKELRSMAK